MGGTEVGTIKRLKTRNSSSCFLRLWSHFITSYHPNFFDTFDLCVLKHEMGSICHDSVAYWCSNECFLRWEEKEQKSRLVSDWMKGRFLYFIQPVGFIFAAFIIRTLWGQKTRTKEKHNFWWKWEILDKLSTSRKNHAFFNQF